ncbi:MAG: Ribokinase-like protein [Benniella sp.]|nr:MAG: Ribokinase-like protein [Benniella sp.]
MSTLSKQQQEAATVPTYTQYRSLVPPLSAHLHKGQGGRVGILGGSSDYTGAPYFSGMSALRLGADLCHIICDEDAATAIKSYSPDIIVHPYIKIRATANLQDEKKSNAIWAQTFDDIGELLKRIHVLVVGPGLSRDRQMLQCAKHAIEKAKELEIPIVIDADGLFLIQHEPELIRGYSKAVLTPNIVEFGRLCSSQDVDATDQSSVEPPVQKLARAFGGVVIVQKGSIDAISDGTTLYAAANDGGLKRSGGQGDILTGLLATSLAWGAAYEKDVWEHDHSVQTQQIPMIAAFGACVLNRESSRLAFEKHKRSVQASDVIPEIGPLFVTFYDKTRVKAGWGEAIYG